MLNTFLGLGLLLSQLAMADPDFEACFKDGKQHGNHLHAITPQAGCEQKIRIHADRIEAKGLQHKLHAFGFKNLLYVNGEGKTKLLAGDQTELYHLNFLRVYESEKKILVYQRFAEWATLSTFDADFIGNVAPTSHLVSKLLLDVTNVALVPESKEIILVSSGSSQVRFINMQADTRYKGGNFTPKASRTIKHELLSYPISATVSWENKRIYIYQPKKILVFELTKDNSTKLLEVRNIEELKQATVLTIEKNILSYGDHLGVAGKIDLSAKEAVE